MSNDKNYEEIGMKAKLKNSPDNDHIEVDDNEAYVCVAPPPLPTEQPAKKNNDFETKMGQKLQELDAKSVSSSDISYKNRLQVIAIVVIAIILVAMLACIIAAFVEISNLKLQDSSQPLPTMGNDLTAMLSELSVNIGFINSSVQDLMINNFLLENRTTFLEKSFQMLSDILNQFPLGLSQSSPAASCSAVLEFRPESPSGFYWVRSSDGSGVMVYCDMTRTCGNITGGWMRVADLNMTDINSVCPPGFNLSNQSDLRTCLVSQFLRECTSLNYSLNGVSYSHVCGMIRAYPDGRIEAFQRHAQHVRPANATVDSNYVDGISLTYGANPRHHIWTFAASCFCEENRPQFIGSDYFCDGTEPIRFCPTICSDIILWDGMGCSTQYNPWFYRQLFQPTNDDIELRVCHDEPVSDEDIAIEAIELYVQ